MDGTVIRSDEGEIVQGVWCELALHYQQVCLDEFIVMPNHVHGIIQLMDEHTIPGRYRLESQEEKTETSIVSVISCS